MERQAHAFAAGVAVAFGLAVLGCHREAPPPWAHTGPVELAPAAASAVPRPSPVAEAVDASTSGPTDADAAPTGPVVVVHWRVSALRITRDARGNDHGSVELELLVDGGSPPRVRLGRRRAYGFTPVPPESGGVASVQSYVEAHGEYADVWRSHPAELQVVAFGQDEAFPDHVPPRTDVRRITVHIPADARVEVDETVLDDSRDE